MFILKVVDLCDNFDVWGMLLFCGVLDLSSLKFDENIDMSFGLCVDFGMFE